MSTITHGFDWPDRFIVGTVGLPGDRTFYLQAKDRDRIFSVALEKQQSAALADAQALQREGEGKARLEQIRAELGGSGAARPAPASAANPSGGEDIDVTDSAVDEGPSTESGDDAPGFPRDTRS